VSLLLLLLLLLPPLPLLLPTGYSRRQFKRANRHRSG
jgi:hypothetical protein